MSASALPGRRLEWYRAGMIAMAETGIRKGEGPVSETGGTADITTSSRAREIAVRSRDKMFGVITASNKTEDGRQKTEDGKNDFWQGGSVRRRCGATRRLSRGGEHAGRRSAVSRARAASGAIGSRDARRRSQRPGRPAAGAHGPGAGPRSESP